MHRVCVACITLMLFPCIVFAQGSAARAGITPESPLYFFDRLGESIAELFAFTPIARARLQLSFATERIAEIETMLVTKGVSAHGISVAETALSEHLQKGALLAQRERQKHNDVFANEIDDSIQKDKEALVHVFDERKQTLEKREAEIQSTINAAESDNGQNIFEQEMHSIQTEKGIIDARIKKYEDGEGGDNEGSPASSSEPLFGKDGTINENEKERLMRSIESVEDEIKRTEEFLKQQKESESAR